MINMKTVYYDGNTNWTDYKAGVSNRERLYVVMSNPILRQAKQDEYQGVINARAKKIQACRIKANTNGHTSAGPLRYIANLLDSHSPGSYQEALQLYLQQPETFGSYFRFLGISGVAFDNFPTLSCIPIQQAYLKRDAPANILLCFTGRTGRLNMPLPIFHGLVSDLYDCIAYFFDPFNDNYSSISETISKACDELLTTYSKARFSIACTSTGGIMAHNLSHRFDHVKKLCSSPTLGKSNRIVSELKRGEHDRFSNSRFFFSLGPSHYHSSTDRESYLLLLDSLSAETFSSNVYNLGFYSESHATLMNLALMSRSVFDLQLKWLLRD
jgi:hypothetical protein